MENDHDGLDPLGRVVVRESGEDMKYKLTFF